VPIVVKLRRLARQDLDLLERLAVPGARGPVMLGQVATLELTGGPAVIDRYDRSRNINFEIELSGSRWATWPRPRWSAALDPRLPPGVRMVEVGDAEVMGELFASFGLAMLTGVLCIYIVLVLLFKDFLHPVTILCALPLSLGGAFVGLLIGQKALLDAVADRPDHADGHRHQELDPAGGVRHRGAPRPWHEPLRRAAGRLPQARAAHHHDHHRHGRGHAADRGGLGAADPSFRSPMAIAVIGGLITSTVLSLLVVPVVFTYVDDIEHWLRAAAAPARRRSR
jgi:multidrug efflux pump subunit AcrB